MQATLDATALKLLTKALFCLSRYGEELTIFVTRDDLALSTTNTSQSAFCRFKYRRQFFSRYNLARPAALPEFLDDDDDEGPSVTGQLQTKNLLSVLKHKTVEKTVVKCELVITDADHPAQGDGDGQDSLESRLTVRLHCKHGVIKTHRLLLQTPNSLLAPAVPNSDDYSRLHIGARAVRDMIEHFTLQKGPKSDPQLIWTFDDYNVQLKGMETIMTAKSGPQIATELTISAEEFERYDVIGAPLTLSFHLREFNATVAYAEATALLLDISFTDAASPIFIDLSGDLTQALCVISTSGLSQHAQAQAQALPVPPQPRIQPKRKRPVDEDVDMDQGPRGESVVSDAGRNRREVVQAMDRASVARSVSAAPAATPLPIRPMPQPSMPPPPPPQTRPSTTRPSSASAARAREPLFLPSSQASEAESELHLPVRDEEPLFLPGTQLSQALRESGLGLESMTAGEFAAMLEGDAEEVEFDEDSGGREASLEIVDGEEDVEMEMAPTQPGGGAKAFRPLFED
ncbi:Rad9-domain-containing protein [Fomitopsis betulina]|nr:Rad9-domain-containing protein [Fomitopsis betulina]